MAAKAKAIRRPRFFVLMLLILAISTITVGVLGWQLTFNSAKENIESLVSDMEALVSNQISSFIGNQANLLQRITATQSHNFAAGRWSVSTPQRQNETLKAMLTVLNDFNQNTVDTYYYDYPDGKMFGYFNLPDHPGQLFMWTQENHTLYTWLTDANGNKQGTPISSVSHDRTLGNIIYLQAGAAIKYMNGYSKFLDPYVWQGAIYKSSINVAVNSATGEIAVFGNDWTMSFLSSQLNQVLATIPYPMFVGMLDATTGSVVATSANVSLISQDQTSILPVNQINDPFFQDLTGYLNGAYYAPNNNLTQQLPQLVNVLTKSYAGSQMFVSRK
ncbi:hypothetical protein HDU99_002222, partial [Rhizoclosmatium hyalinum]